MKKKNVKLVFILLFFLFFVLPLVYIGIEREIDQNKIAQNVCKEKDLELLDQHSYAYDTSNITSEISMVTEYLVECSNNKIYSYKPFRYITWTFKDYSTKDKWGQYKTKFFPTRHKAIGFNYVKEEAQG